MKQQVGWEIVALCQLNMIEYENEIAKFSENITNQGLLYEHFSILWF